MKQNCSSQFGKLIAVTTAACTISAVTGRCAHAFTSADADIAVNAYLKAFVTTEGGESFIKGKQDGGKTGFWQEIEQVEGIEDANDRSGGAYKDQITALLNGFVKRHGSNWSNNDFKRRHRVGGHRLYARLSSDRRQKVPRHRTKQLRYDVRPRLGPGQRCAVLENQQCQLQLLRRVSGGHRRFFAEQRTQRFQL